LFPDNVVGVLMRKAKEEDSVISGMLVDGRSASPSSRGIARGSVSPRRRKL
jgi:hypothetical protein